VATFDSRFLRVPTVLDDLSHRELQVLRLASSGSTNGQIGQDLGVSIHAVKFHLASVYRKLGVGNRTEAAGVFLRSTTASASATEESR
jgi:DNA-binding CsgD family transcriptional regulator